MITRGTFLSELLELQYHFSVRKLALVLLMKAQWALSGVLQRDLPDRQGPSLLPL